MRAGRKIHPVGLCAPVQSKTEAGGKKLTYSKVHDAFAGIEPGGRIGGRKHNDDQDNTFDRVLIVIDYMPDFRADWQIKDLQTGLFYKVMRMQNTEMRNTELLLECRSVEDI